MNIRQPVYVVELPLPATAKTVAERPYKNFTSQSAYEGYLAQWEASGSVVVRSSPLFATVEPRA